MSKAHVLQAIQAMGCFSGTPSRARTVDTLIKSHQAARRKKAEVEPSARSACVGAFLFKHRMASVGIEHVGKVVLACFVHSWRGSRVVCLLAARAHSAHVMN